MCRKQRFFLCGHCGNMIGLIDDKGVPVVCCGEEMTELIPNTVEASVEKHLPDIAMTDDYVIVNIGSVPHPMENAHHISFVYMETKRGGQRKCLKPGEEPHLTFSLIDDKPIALFAYCNQHGLWKKECD